MRGRDRALFRVALGLMIPALAGCGPSLKQLNRLATAGDVHRSAPVIAHVQIEIAAPAARVWEMLVNAPAWPGWDPDITKVSVTQPLALGTRFTWGKGTTTVHSQVQLFEPERRLGWTGTALTAKAVHQWQLTPLPEGHTEVAITESMDGPLMSLLLPSQKLAESASAWLAQLKAASERRP